MTTATINVAGLSVGAITANSLDATHFSNPADTVIQNNNWTGVTQTKYLNAGSSDEKFIIKSLGTFDARDVEVTTWARLGYTYLRIDGSGNAIYFLHQGETTNGLFEIGIVKGLDETSYPGGTYYPLYQNANLQGTVPGYHNGSQDTTGDTFTFGCSGFDIYAKFNGTEFTRFKDYRQMSSGAVGLKTIGSAGYGFRSIVWTTFANASLFSNYASNQLDLRDWNVRSLQTTGSISASSTSLTVASSAGFQVGDWVIVEIGAEAGAGARGTIGVAGQWPAQKYADSTAMNLDHGQITNTFAWTQNDGVVYQWNGSTWSSSFGNQSYYVSKAIPLSLHARITAIVSNTITLDTAATASTTNANVYLDNQPYINYLTASQNAYSGADLTPITPSGMTIIAPSGSYSASGRIYLAAAAGWTFKGAGKASTTLFAPKGVYSLHFFAATYNSPTLQDFTLNGNWGIDKFGLATSGFTYVPGGLTAAGLMLANNDTQDAYLMTQTALPNAFMYPPGVLFISLSNGTAQDININDVSQDAIGASFCTNVWAYRCAYATSVVFQSYIQWMFEWSDTVGGGHVDCSVTSPALIQGFESFNSTGHQMIRPVSVNGAFSQNNAGNWLIQDATITISDNHTGSLPPSWDNHNPLVNINSNIGNSNAGLGGLIKNMNITVQGYINTNNDVPTGIIINVSNPNVSIWGGSYTAPDWVSPSTLSGPIGINSTGTNADIVRFISKGTVKSGSSNIQLSSGNIYRCTANAVSTGAGVVTPPSSPGGAGLRMNYHA